MGLLWILGLLACGQPAAPPVAPAPAPVAPAAEARSLAPLPDGWLEAVSPGASATEPLPMVVMVHGLGDGPESMLGLMRQLPGPVRVIAPEGPTPWGNGHAWFTLRVRDGDVDALAAQMRSEAERFATQLAEVAATRPTQGKPVLAGFSQGGMLSFTVAAHHPEVIAKAVPVAGWLPAPLVPTAAPAGAVPIVALHGDADPVLPLAPTQASVEALAAAGFDVTLTTFPGVEHRIPSEVRRALYDAVREVP